MDEITGPRITCCGQRHQEANCQFDSTTGERTRPLNHKLQTPGQHSAVARPCGSPPLGRLSLAPEQDRLQQRATRCTGQIARASLHRATSTYLLPCPPGFLGRRKPREASRHGGSLLPPPRGDGLGAHGFSLKHTDCLFKRAHLELRRGKCVEMNLLAPTFCHG